MANWYVSSVAYSAVQTWSALTGGVATAVSLGTIVRQTSPTIGYERCFVCTTAGTTSTSEPSWNLTYGGTNTDGTVVWTNHTGLESLQSAGNWKAPMARLSHITGSTYAINGLPVTTGDTIFVSNDHAETFASGYTQGSTNSRLNYLSVSRTGATLPPTSVDLLRGASVTLSTAANLQLQQSDCYQWGIDYISAGSIYFYQQDFGSATYENCSFQLSNTNTGYIIDLQGDQQSNIGAIIWDNTYVKFGFNTQVIELSAAQFEWRNTSNPVQGTIPTTLFVYGTNQISHGVLIHSLDLSAISGTLFNTGSGVRAFGKTIIRDCKLNSAITLVNTANSGNWGNANTGFADIVIDNCDDTINARNYRMFHANVYGATQQTTALIRPGGNTDGVTQFSWQMATSGHTPSFGSPSFFPTVQQRWNTTGVSKTLTIYGISSFPSIPNNSNFWLNVEYLGSSASPIATLLTTRVATPLNSVTNVTADNSDWTTNVPYRANSTSYTQGNLIKVPDNTGRVFICTTNGTSAVSEPIGYSSAVDGGSVTDGGAVFMAMWRWKLTTPSFTPQLAGTIKCTPFTTLYSSVNYLVEYIVIDPTFILN